VGVNLKAAKFDVRVVEAPGTLVNCVGRLAIRGRNFDLTCTRSYTTELGNEATEEIKLAAYIIDEIDFDTETDTLMFTDDEGFIWGFEVIEVVKEEE
jgi:hypothetical protein